MRICESSINQRISVSPQSYFSFYCQVSSLHPLDMLTTVKSQVWSKIYDKCCYPSRSPVLVTQLTRCQVDIFVTQLPLETKVCMCERFNGMLSIFISVHTVPRSHTLL